VTLLALPGDDEAGRLVPLYTNSARKLKVLDLIVINRLLPAEREGSRLSDIDIFGFPFIFQVESFRSCEHVFRHLVEQSLRYLTEEELATLQANGLFDLDPHEGDSEPSWIRTELLPFKIRLVSFQEPQATPQEDGPLGITNSVSERD
jgi:hypothetical protein